jgi:uncharacterized protein
MPTMTPEQALRSCTTVAVLGAHHEPRRAAFYVPDYLVGQGYRVLPVNPRLVGEKLWGQPVRATLAELKEPVHMVDVFRRADDLPDHLDDLLAMRPLPRVVWFQLGIRNAAVAAHLDSAGISVIQDRCTLADHDALRIGPVGPGPRR